MELEKFPPDGMLGKFQKFPPKKKYRQKHHFWMFQSKCHQKNSAFGRFFLRSLIFYITLIDISQLNALEIRHRGEYRVAVRIMESIVMVFRKQARAVFDWDSLDQFFRFSIATFSDNIMFSSINCITLQQKTNVPPGALTIS